jgi:hypothetical protein
VLGGIIRFGRPYQSQVQLSFEQSRSDSLLSGGEVGTQIPVELGPAARQYQFPCWSANYGNSEFTLASRLPINNLNPNQISIANDMDYLMLALSAQKNALAYLGGYKDLLKNGEVRLNHPSSRTELPELWWTYLAQDAVIVHDLPALRLTPAVEQALLSWTQSGGQLVLVSSLDTQEYRGSAFEVHLPLQPEGVTAGQPPMLVGRHREAEILQSHQGRPLLLRKKYGCGQIFQITASVTQQEALGVARTAELWKQIIVRDADGLRLRRRCFDQQRRLSQLPELPTPATSALAWFLFAYCALVLPSIYFYLRRKDQVLRLIVFVPLVSTLVTIGAYWFNSRGRGKELVQRELGMLFLASGQRQGLLDQSSALFSPSPIRFGARLNESTFLRPDSYIHRDETIKVSYRGQELRLEEAKLPQWGISRWRGLGLRQSQGWVKLRRVGQQIEVDNGWGKALQGYLLNSQQSSARVDFPVGRSRHSLQAASAPESFFDLPESDRQALFLTLDDLRTGTTLLLADLGQEEQYRVFQPDLLKPRYLSRTLLVVYGD